MDVCEACYVPLLLTPSPLEAVGPQGLDTIVITTYERDSIWSSEKDVRVAAGDVAADARKVRVRTGSRARQYRYQEVPPGEVVRLLENPRGTIPVHRPRLPSIAPDDVARLLADFRRLAAPSR